MLNFQDLVETIDHDIKRVDEELFKIQANFTDQSIHNDEVQDRMDISEAYFDNRTKTNSYYEMRSS